MSGGNNTRRRGNLPPMSSIERLLDDGAHLMRKNKIQFVVELITRVTVIGLFLLLEDAPPLMTEVQDGDYGLYKFSYGKKSLFKDLGPVGVPLAYVLDPNVMMVAPIVVVTAYSIGFGNNVEFFIGCGVPTMSIPPTGLVINITKILVGRLRPNFFARCYGEKYMKYYDLSYDCTGNVDVVMNGRKSFPSGHSGLGFASFGFILLYLAGKTGIFRKRHPNRYFAPLIVVPTLLLATINAISRVYENQHHWQDVVVGGLIGFFTSFLVYHVYFPSVGDEHADYPNYFLAHPEDEPNANGPEANDDGITEIYRDEHFEDRIVLLPTP